MGQVAVNVNGRLYRFDCGDGEEARLEELAGYVKSRIEALVSEYGNVGDDRLLVTAALLITDELLDARAAIAELEQAALKSQRQEGVAASARTAAERRDDALRAEYRRRMTAGGDA